MGPAQFQLVPLSFVVSYRIVSLEDWERDKWSQGRMCHLFKGNIFKQNLIKTIIKMKRVSFFLDFSLNGVLFSVFFS